MEEARKEKMQTIVFWLDGFASLSGIYFLRYASKNCVPALQMLVSVGQVLALNYFMKSIASNSTLQLIYRLSVNDPHCCYIFIAF